MFRLYVCVCVCIQPDGSNALQLFTAGEISHTFEVLTCGCVLVFFPLDLTGNTFSSLITHTHADMRPKKESFPVFSALASICREVTGLFRPFNIILTYI